MSNRGGCLLFGAASYMLVFGAVLLGLGYPVGAVVVATLGAVAIAACLEME